MNERTTWALDIVDNPELRRLPTFRSFARLSRLEIIDRPRLEAGPELPLLAVIDQSPDPRTLMGVVIRHNPSLRDLAGFSALSRTSRLYVTDNDALERVRFARLREVENQLSTARNPQLPKSELVPFARVRAGSTNLRGNLGASARSGCAGPDDGECPGRHGTPLDPAAEMARLPLSSRQGLGQARAR